MIWMLLRRGRTVWWRVCERLNCIATHIDAHLARGTLQLGRMVVFHVPVRVDGAGSVVIRDFCQIGYRQAPRLGAGDVLLQAREPDAVISIGQRVHFSNNVSVVACFHIVIGNDCLIGDGVTIFDSDFHDPDPKKRKTGGGRVAKVVIGENVWLGSRAMVLKGVNIGSGAVVAPLSVVTKDVPENSFVAGVPAKVIHYLD